MNGGYHMKDKDCEEYERMFIRFSDGIERWMLKITMILFVCLWITQSLMQIPSVRYWLSTIEKLEGFPYDENDLLQDETTMLKNENQHIDFLQQL